MNNLLDNSLKSAPILPNAAVVYANYASFLPGRVVEFDKVQSRMLVWCLSGGGEIEVNSKGFEISPKSFLFLPWNHSIRYKAAVQNPFLLAGIHIVPFLKSTQDFYYKVFHTERSDLPEYNRRADAPIEGLEGIIEGKFAANSRLEQLADYTVRWFLSGEKPLFMAKFLASAIFFELLSEKKEAQRKSKAAAGSLGTVLSIIDNDATAPLDIDRLAKIAGLCRSSLFRLFRKHLNTTPGRYILVQRLNFAAELLKKSSLPIGEIAARVGIEDQYYFSKLFKQQYKITATQYRRKNSLI